MKTDVVIIGAGITGLQAALDLADQGKKIILVDQSPSIGGRMINLSKVFPTLDCASCITTPKMAASSHHQNITCLTMTELLSIKQNDKVLNVTLQKNPRHVIEDDCIGCKRCEEVCPVYVKDPFEHGLGAKKAISIPFTNAIPQFPVLDLNACTLCGACAKACPTKCIDFEQEKKTLEIEASSVLLATGHEITPMSAKKQYGEGRMLNVLSPMQAERLLAPHGPFGRVLRPSDGKIPDSIAFVQCAGSRDQSISVPYCSRVCCMYSIKQAMLLSGSLPICDITIYYMDIRAFGKGYEQFYQNAKAMGIQFVKAKVAKISEDENNNLILRIERQEENSNPEDRPHDLVILSQGMIPRFKENSLVPVSCASDGFLTEVTKTPGVFCAGTALGPKDIVDSIIEASAIATEIGNYLKA